MLPQLICKRVYEVFFKTPVTLAQPPLGRHWEDWIRAQGNALGNECVQTQRQRDTWSMCVCGLGRGGLCLPWSTSQANAIHTSKSSLNSMA